MRSPDLTREIIGAAIKIHRALGPGSLESAYEACLAYELQRLGMKVERQKPVSLIYEQVTKSKDALHPIDDAQLLSHLRLLNLSVGLLINFHVTILRDGIKRLVNNYRDPISLVI